MRNFYEHPITYDEAFALLAEVKEHFSRGIVGDPRRVIIEWIEEQLFRMESLEK